MESDPKDLGALTAEQLVNQLLLYHNYQCIGAGPATAVQQMDEFRAEILRRLAPPPAHEDAWIEKKTIEEDGADVRAGCKPEAPPAQDVKALCPECGSANFSVLMMGRDNQIATCGMCDCQRPLAQFFHAHMSERTETPVDKLLAAIREKFRLEWSVDFQEDMWNGQNMVTFAAEIALAQLREAIESGHLRHKFGCNALKEKARLIEGTSAYEWISAGEACSCGFSDKYGDLKP